MSRPLRFLSLLLVCSVAPVLFAQAPRGEALMRRLPSLLVALLFAAPLFAQSADLSVTLTMPATAFYSWSGDASANGQFTVTNAGPSIAQNVTIDFGTNVSATYVSGFNCGPANGRYLCTAVSLVPGTISGTFVVAWPFPANGTVEATTVKVTSSSPADPNPTNDSASANTTVIWRDNVQLTNVAARYPVAPGGYVAVYVDYSDGGPSPPTDFKLTISLPPGVLYDSYSTDDLLKCAEPPKGGQGDMVCTETGPAGSYFELVVRVDPAVTPGTVLTVPVTLSCSDAPEPSQTKSASIKVIQAADLRAEISAPATATPGEPFPTTITVTNQGPGTAIQTIVSYSQKGVGPVGPMTGPAGWSCGGRSCTNDAFAPGTATFTIPTTIPSNFKSGIVTGQATASSPSDPNFADDIATATTVIVPPPQAAFRVTLTASPATVYSGDQLTYTVQIANTSNVDAQDVRLHWNVPGTLIATSCGTTSNMICTFATIAAGATQTATRTVHVDAGAGTVLTASAAVEATNVIYDDQSDLVALSTTVAGIPHVDLEPTIFPPPAVRAGTTALWTFGINNHGPDTVTDWQLTVALPPNTTLVSYGLGPYTCSASTVLACHGTYLPTPPLNIPLFLTVAPGTTTPIHATASVSTTNIDPNPFNNSVSVDTPIHTAAQLSATITADKTAVVTEESLTQTFTVTNNGPDAATGIVLDARLPPGSGFSTTSTFASCTGTATIHCVAPVLAAGESLQAAVSFLAPAIPSTFPSDAYVSWDNSGSTSAYTQLQVIAPPLPPATARRRAAHH